jgi:hypothetical protein
MKGPSVYSFIAIVAVTTALLSSGGVWAFKYVEKVEASVVLGNSTVNITSVQKRSSHFFFLHRL